MLLVYGQDGERVRVDPDHANYYIKGDVSVSLGRDGSAVYRLSNIEKRGIFFDDIGTINGVPRSEDVCFQFSHATTDYDLGLDAGLDFWRYDEEIQEWQFDSEVDQGTPNFERSRVLVMTIVIDCSTSISDNFQDVKAMTRQLIEDLLARSDGGNIRIGIIGFSSSTTCMNIMPLTRNNVQRIYDFINRLHTGNGTAMYQAIDEAYTMMSNYVGARSNGITESNYGGSCMITFTDGLDQGSQNLQKGILTSDDYLRYVEENVLNASIMGRSYDREYVFLRGGDIMTDKQFQKYQGIARRLSSRASVSNDFAAAQREFRRIARDLTVRWSHLQCFIPKGISGKVAWTFREPRRSRPAPAPAPVVVATREVRPLLGLKLGIGTGTSTWNSYSTQYEGGGYYSTTDETYQQTGVAINLGADIAFPIGAKKFSVGGYANLGFNGGAEGVSFCVGPLGMYNFENGNGIMAGLGLGVIDGDAGFNFRAAFHFKGPWYVGFDNLVGYSSQSLVFVGFDFGRIGRRR